MKSSMGFSLVELMISITLALIVTAGVMSVFIGSRSAFQATAGTSALSDSGRFALNFLENSVRDTGNMACGAPVRTTINVNAEPTNLFYGFPASPFVFQPLGGFEAANTGVGNAYTETTTAGVLTNWNPSLDNAFTSLGNLPIKGNDILVTRSSTRGAQPAYLSAPTLPNSISLANVPSTLATGTVAVISDCVKSVIFQITGTTATTLAHSSGSGSPGNQSTTFPASIAFDIGAQVTPLQTTAYFIGVGADGDGALFSADVNAANALTANELVPDIEAMQVLYGIDSNLTQTVAYYTTADNVVDFSTVMSVKIALLAAGPPGAVPIPATAPTYNVMGTTVTVPRDTRSRQVFQITVAVRNSLP